MKKTIHLLKTMNIKEPNNNFNTVSPINDSLRFFLIRQKKIESTDKNRSFIKEFNKYAHNDMKKVEGLNRYYFHLKYAIIEILIFKNSNSELIIEPSILYDDNIMKNNIQRLIYREHKLYHIFKKINLQ